VHYFLVSSFDGIEYVRIENALCSTANQTFNDMLEDYDKIDETALIEGLAEYYYIHGESFDGLDIKLKNKARFDYVKDLSVGFYSCR
jgi:hypothetical protein